MIWPIRTQLPADTSAITQLLREVQTQCAENKLSDRTAYLVALVVEEICLNIMKHAYADRDAADPGPMGFEMGVSSEHVMLVFRDHGPMFDPTAQRPDPAMDNDGPAIGGVGLRLIHQNAQAMDYQRDQDTNVLRITLARED